MIHYRDENISLFRIILSRQDNIIPKYYIILIMTYCSPSHIFVIVIYYYKTTNVAIIIYCHHILRYHDITLTENLYLLLRGCIHKTLYSGRKPCPLVTLIRQTHYMFGTWICQDTFGSGTDTRFSGANKTYDNPEPMAYNPDARASLWPIVQLPTHTIINTSSRLIVNTLISVPLNRQIGCMFKTFGKTRKTRKV